MPQDGNAGLKKMFARIRRGLRLVVGGILMLIVISVVINFFDEDLASETQGMLARSPNPYSPHENIYIALAGANAPSGQSVTEAGLARIKRYDDQSDLPISEQAARDLASLDMPASGLSFHGQFAHCPTDKPVPWAEAPKWRAEIEAAFNANQELYERYLALYRLVGYFETARPGMLAPFVFPGSAMRCLFRAETALVIQTGTREEQAAAFVALAADIRLWKRVLKGDGSLVSKMVAGAYLHGDFALVADLMGNSKVDATLFEAERADLVTPWPIDDWKVGKVFAEEYRVASTVYSSFHRDAESAALMKALYPNWWNRMMAKFDGHFLKEHATENASARVAREVIRWAESDPAHFSESGASYRRWLEKETSLMSPRTLYNPSGKILIAIASSDYGSYIERMYDVAAFQRLVCLAHEIRRQGIAVAAIPEFLRVHPELSTHPIGRVPFEWNAAKFEISMKPVGQHPAGRPFSLTLSGLHSVSSAAIQ